MDRVQEVKERFLELHGVLSIHDFITGWFHGAPYEQIHRGNVLDFVAYGFYSKRPQDLSPKVKQPVSGCLWVQRLLFMTPNGVDFSLLSFLKQPHKTAQDAASQ